MNDFVNSLLKGLGISLLLVFSVGPLIFTIIKQSVNHGRVGGFSFVAGIWLSDFMWAILSNAFSSLVSELLHFKEQIGFIGGAFLIAMGVYYLFFKRIKLNPEGINVSAATHVKLFTSGFFINALNPGLIAFWLSWATTFSTHTPIERIIIFSTCLLVNSSADILKVTLAGKLREKLTLKTMLTVNRISGSLLLGFGIVLIAGVFYALVKH
jgi:threonine/homoserine/homoserine lactone efflux protein